jgi:hypothetical protein
VKQGQLEIGLPLGFIKEETTINIRRAKLSCSALLCVESELQSTGEHELSLRYFEPMVLTRMQCSDE